MPAALQIPNVYRSCCLLMLSLVLGLSAPICVAQSPPAPRTTSGIRPWPENSWYWSYDGHPVMLIGGSDDDNLFQWPRAKLLAQLNRIANAGGNVVRNTMSDRRDGGWEVYPFQQLGNGKYDLAQWNPEYWSRFEFFLKETAKRNIFVQIEVWDRFDYTDNRASDPQRWENHPYNPINNVNYSAAETGLDRRYPEHPGANKQPFFFSTPQQRNITALLRFQTAFVHKMLDYSLSYDHIMYCIDNETKAEPAWGKYWAELIRKRAQERDRYVPITEMWDDWDLSAERHRQTFDHPEIYDFVDISQNNHNNGEEHWNNLVHVRSLLTEQPRPMNTTKTYGADGNKFGHSDQDAIERFWRHFLGGAASVRFHRPDSGLGINDKAVACLKAARTLMTSVPVWELTPAMERLRERTANECYAAATSNASTVALYFPAAKDERSIEWQCDTPQQAKWQVQWVDIDSGQARARIVQNGCRFSPPANIGNALAIAKRIDRTLLSGEWLKLDGHSAFVFLPPEDLRRSPQPWVMYSPTLIPMYPDEHERWLHESLLRAGIAVAGIDVGEAYGSPQSVVAMDRLYRHLTNERGFAPRAALLARSRGGLWATRWASEHPELVSGLAGIYPVFDLQSYPGIDRAARAYGITPAAMQDNVDDWNPIVKARTLAENALPAHLIHGVADSVVPFAANSARLQAMYVQAGNGDAIEVNAIAEQGHNYWPGFFRSQPLLDFLIRAARQGGQGE